MKKLFSLLASAALLTGCTPLLPSPHGDVPESDTVILSTQFPVYDKDIDRIQVILENAGDTNLEYGAEWAVETRQGDDWKQLPFAEGYGWIQPLYTLMPGGTDNFYVSMDMLDYNLKDGTYRIVKEISGQVYTAEFMIGESTVSADSPFGYVPLEELPEDYSTEDAARDGCVVYHCLEGSYENEEKISAFLHDVVRGVQTQIRFAFYSSDTPEKILIDEVIYTHGNGSTPRFQIRRDWSRQQPEASIISQYFTNLTTRNDKLFLFANAPDTYFLGEYSSAEIGALNENWAGKEEWLKTIAEDGGFGCGGISAWSPDGLRHVQASPDDVLHFYVNISYPEGGSMGYTADLLQVKPAVKITEVFWQDNTVVILECINNMDGVQYYGNDGKTYTYCFYDTEKEELIRTVVSSEKYYYDNDMNIVIPE